MPETPDLRAEILRLAELADYFADGMADLGEAMPSERYQADQLARINAAVLAAGLDESPSTPAARVAQLVVERDAARAEAARLADLCQRLAG